MIGDEMCERTEHKVLACLSACAASAEKACSRRRTAAHARMPACGFGGSRLQPLWMRRADRQRVRKRRLRAPSRRHRTPCAADQGCSKGWSVNHAESPWSQLIILDRLWLLEERVWLPFHCSIACITSRETPTAQPTRSHMKIKP
jgi:hypothetical protein